MNVAPTGTPYKNLKRTLAANNRRQTFPDMAHFQKK